jgi:hypothetical protein
VALVVLVQQAQLLAQAVAIQFSHLSPQQAVAVRVVIQLAILLLVALAVAQRRVLLLVAEILLQLHPHKETMVGRQVQIYLLHQVAVGQVRQV